MKFKRYIVMNNRNENEERNDVSKVDNVSIPKVEKRTKKEI